MKIAIISRNFPPYAGGAEQQLSRVGRELSKAGHSVTVFCGYPCENKTATQNLQIIQLYNLKIRFLGSLFFLSSLCLNMLLRSNRFDYLIVSQINETSSAATITGRLLRKKILFRPSSTGKHGNVSWTYMHKFGFFYRFIIRLAHGMIAQADSLVDEAKKLNFPLDKIFIIPNMAPTISSEKMKKTSGKPVILWCGRFVSVKRPDLMVETMQNLIQSGVSAKCIMAGNGDLSLPIKSLIKQTNFTDSIVLPGFQPDMSELYRQATVLVNTSDSEAMPNAVLEAMAYGIPVAATSTKGANQLIKNNINGLLSPIGDSEALAKNISLLIYNSSLRNKLVENSFSFIKRNFSADVIVPLYVKALKSI